MPSALAFDPTPASNTTINGDASSNTMSPAKLDDIDRSLAAAMASMARDLGGYTSTTGSANAYLFASQGHVVTALANGQMLSFKASFSNTGASTLQVDALTAKAIRKWTSAGEAALATGDIISGGHYQVQYNTAANGAAGAWILLNSTLVSFSPGANDAAALGASGTAFSDLFLASGGVINWLAGDVTITHSSNTLAFAGASSGYTFDGITSVSVSSGVPLTLTLSDNGAGGGPVLDLKRTSTSPAANDTIGNVRYLGKDDGGNDHVYGGTLVSIVNPGDGAEEGALGLTISIAGTNAVRASLISTAFRPESDDGLALGVSGTAWADLFLASGGVINWNAGDVTITHSANTLTFAGASSGFLFESPLRMTSAFFGLGAKVTHTISSGAITAASSNIGVTGEGDLADDLVTINGGSDGDILVISANNASTDITVKNDSGNIRLGGSVDRVLDHTDDRLVLLKVSTVWIELSFISVS